LEAEAKKKDQGPASSSPWTLRLQVLALPAACDTSQRRDGTANRFPSIGDFRGGAREAGGRELPEGIVAA
jgi:hypothetical protein